MKNFIDSGETVTVVTPAGGATSGAGLLIGALFGIPATTQAQDEEVVLYVKGKFELAKVSAQAWTVGAKVYWDNTAKLVTTTASGNTFIGVACAVAANPSATGIVRLSAAFV